MSDISQILVRFANDTIGEARNNLQSSSRRTKYKRINASGALSKSLRARAERDPKGMALVFSMNDYGVHMDRGVMGNKRRILKYWNKSIFLPRGRGYGNRMPPVAKIQTWMNKKGVKGNPFPIARNIQRRGVAPTLFFTDAFKKYEKDLPDDVLLGFDKQVEELLND